MTTYGSAAPTTRLVLKSSDRSSSSSKKALMALGIAAVMACTYTAATSSPMASTMFLSKNNMCNLKTGDVIALQADTGKYFARCSDCIPNAAFPDAAFVHAPNSKDSSSHWTVTAIKNGKVALQGDNGKFLARCTNCAPYAIHESEAFIHVEDWNEGAWAQWSCEATDNGKIALADDTGKYLARCNNCVNGAFPDAGFLHVDDWKKAHHAQWQLHHK
ncbi:cytochrome P450 [Thraustotheca clavata]|uniref:Cytochrome P450 n=1 Tax=Thraustotheca clavata TaxID=74557 RepID=A0A1W0A9F5_9STRA|nr:cytochrome P450 [Thraustotheca clavata]